MMVKIRKIDFLKLVSFFVFSLIFFGGFFVEKSLAFGQSITVSATSTADDGTTVSVSTTFTFDGLNSFQDAVATSQAVADAAVDIINSSGVDALTETLDDAVDSAEEGHEVTKGSDGSQASYSCTNGLELTYTLPDSNDFDPDPYTPSAPDPDPYIPPAPVPDPYIPPAPVPDPVAGQCNTANATIFENTVSSWPSSVFCLSGILSSTPTFPNAGTSVSWQCNGSNGGASSSCTACRKNDCSCADNLCSYESCSDGCSGTCNGMKPTLNGECGDVMKSPTCAKPTSNLCNLGSPSTVTSNGNYWQWTCSGICGGTTVSCSVRKECSWMETSN